MCGLFMEYNAIEFAIYTNDTTSYAYGQSFDEIIQNLEIDMSKISEWFYQNDLKAIQEKISFFTKRIRRQTSKNIWIY